jgi:hypothetical protein
MFSRKGEQIQCSGSYQRGQGMYGVRVLRSMGPAQTKLLCRQEQAASTSHAKQVLSNEKDNHPSTGVDVSATTATTEDDSCSITSITRRQQQRQQRR